MQEFLHAQNGIFSIKVWGFDGDYTRKVRISLQLTHMELIHLDWPDFKILSITFNLCSGLKISKTTFIEISLNNCYPQTDTKTSVSSKSTKFCCCFLHERTEVQILSLFLPILHKFANSQHLTPIQEIRPSCWSNRKSHFKKICESMKNLSEAPVKNYVGLWTISGIFRYVDIFGGKN